MLKKLSKISGIRVVIDTNVFVSGIFWKGVPNRILSLWEKKFLCVFVTDKILKEYLLVLKRFEVSDRLFERWKFFLLNNVCFVQDKERFSFCRDKKDKICINCAIESNSEFLITGDKDLLVLKKVDSVKIVTPAVFLGKFL